MRTNGSYDLKFEEATHSYRLNGRACPSVTQMITAALGSPYPAQDAEWRMQRGRAVHACAAMIAQGKQFDYDPEIEGYVNAIRKWFKDFAPVVENVELRVGNVLYQYAGTADLIYRKDDKLVVLDWKNSLEPERTRLQLAFYSLCFAPPIRWGIGVELHKDGSYKTSGLGDLRRAQNEAMAVRTVYSIKERIGDDHHDEVCFED